MAKKLDEPKVRISRRCFVCGKVFIVGHPNVPDKMCAECREVLVEMIREKQNAQNVQFNAPK